MQVFFGNNLSLFSVDCSPFNRSCRDKSRVRAGHLMPRVFDHGEETNHIAL